MAVHTLLLDFRIFGQLMAEQADIETIVLRGIELEGHLDVNSFQALYHDAFVSTFRGPRESMMTVRRYPEGIVTVTIEYFLLQGDFPLLTYEQCKTLEAKWSEVSGVPKNVKTIPRVLRGMTYDAYFPTTDERLVEYDIDGIVFDGRSEFQHVQIFHSKSFGNMLVLDDDPNLAESDTLYTDCLMRRGTENYENAEILILGGGDGALLYELLKENPKRVVMIEIDEMVMKAARENLKNVCGSVLDEMKGKNYEILIGDCIPKMKEMLEREQKFDFIFGDLTTVPIATSGEDRALQQLLTQVLEISFQILRKGGKYLTHGPGTSGPQHVEMLEHLVVSQANAAHVSVQISKKTAFIPSFSENWTFYDLLIQ